MRNIEAYITVPEHNKSYTVRVTSEDHIVTIDHVRSLPGFENIQIQWAMKDPIANIQYFNSEQYLKIATFMLKEYIATNKGFYCMKVNQIGMHTYYDKDGREVL